MHRTIRTTVSRNDAKGFNSVFSILGGTGASPVLNKFSGTGEAPVPRCNQGFSSDPSGANSSDFMKFSNAGSDFSTVSVGPVSLKNHKSDPTDAITTIMRFKAAGLSTITINP